MEIPRRITTAPLKWLKDNKLWIPVITLVGFATIYRLQVPEAPSTTENAGEVFH